MTRTLAVLLSLLVTSFASAADKPREIVATFSTVACDLERQEWGVAVQSRVLAVGSVVPYAKVGIGAVATQADCNTTFGPRGLEMTVDRYEIRDGGTWRYIHRDADGNEYGFHGVFHGQPSLDGITQTFEFEGAPGHVMLEWLTFEERDGKTTIHANSVAQSVADRDAMVESGMESGVVEGYERLDELLAKLKG